AGSTPARGSDSVATEVTPFAPDGTGTWLLPRTEGVRVLRAALRVGAPVVLDGLISRVRWVRLPHPQRGRSRHTECWAHRAASHSAAGPLVPIAQHGRARSRHDRGPWFEPRPGHCPWRGGRSGK